MAILNRQTAVGGIVPLLALLDVGVGCVFQPTLLLCRHIRQSLEEQLLYPPGISFAVPVVYWARYLRGRSLSSAER